MTTVPDIIYKLVDFGYFLANIIVFGLATAAYQDTRKRSLLMIAISSGIAAVLIVVPWIREDTASWGFWWFYMVATVCDLSLYVIGMWLLLRDYPDLVRRYARNAPPEAGPAPLPGQSDAGDAPPSER